MGFHLCLWNKYKYIHRRAGHDSETSTMSARAIWYVAATKKSAKNTLYMHCHVKPGASKTREGVLSVNDEAVELCVAAQAREGEANKAVIKVLSEVCISSPY
jgi:hypothetical protein